MLLALTLWVCTALPVAEVPRPGPAAQEAAVQVLLSEKDVSVEPGADPKKVFKVARGMLLEKSDRIVVGPGAWVALAIIANEHVVRLDDDLSLLVSDLALLNAPRHTQSPAQQLDGLLTKQERTRNERLIGWHASPTAANTQPVQPEMKKDTSGGAKGMSKALPMPESSERERPPPKEEPRRDRNKSSSDDDDQLEKFRPRGEPVPASPPPPPPAPSPATMKPPVPTPPAPGGAAGLDPELLRCIDGAALTWGAEVRAKLRGSVIVSAKLRDGELLLRLPWGLPPPECLGGRRGSSALKFPRFPGPLRNCYVMGGPRRQNTSNPGLLRAAAIT